MSDQQEQIAIYEAHTRYTKAAHAMQSGVMIEMSMNMEAAAVSPKQLRVGVNSALVDSNAMANLLMKKGLITELEYVEAIADAMEAEQKRYESLLSNAVGKQVTLG